MLPASSKLLLFHLYVFLLSCHIVALAGATASPFSFSFNFSDGSSRRSADLRFEGDAVQHGDLACNSMARPFKNCTGRMSYKHPVPVYHAATGEVASFTTRFTFAIKAGKVRAGGMAFFLAGYPSRLTSRGGDLVLHADADRFVAVKFGTYGGNTCGSRDRIAIDVGTARGSLNATCLPSLSLQEGSMSMATSVVVTFNSSTNMLLASLHYLNNNPSRARGPYQVSIHLPDPVTSLLPPEVVVGFSFQNHQILSWSFDSTLATTRTETDGPEAKPDFVVSRKDQTMRALAQLNSSSGQPPPAGINWPAPPAYPYAAPDPYPSSVPPPPAYPYLNITPPRNSSSVPAATEKGVTGEPTSVPLMIGVAFVVIGSILVAVWFGVASYKHTHQGDSFVKGARDLAKRFEYHELSVATDKFSKSRELGQGAFGVVYVGKLKDQDNQQYRVAVKKLKGCDEETENFHAELNTISETRHKNLARLKGWCGRNRSNLIDFMCWWRQKRSVELFLVYELVPCGSLDVFLNDKTRFLSWETRYNIVKGIGSALRYLHHECNRCILHRDIKPGNILLDGQFNAKLADFGLSRTAHYKNEAGQTTAKETLRWDSRSTAVVHTRAIGTKAYMDPNCIKDGIVSFTRYSDVYSFGVVLLEIACTGKPRAYVRELYKQNPEKMEDAADARLKGNFDVAQMQRVVVLGLWCSSLNDRQRPSMLQAMEVLERGAELPNLRE